MPDPITAAIGGTSIIGGAIGARGAKKAAKAQSRAAMQAADLQAQQFREQQAAYEPFRQAGLTSQNELMRQLGLSGEPTSAGYGNLMRNFSMQDFQADPGYAFRLAEGQKALERQAAARGGLISGAALKAAQQYGQGMASQEYQNAFDRYQANRANVYNMLAGQQGIGVNAVTNLGQAGQNYANQAGEAYMGAGNARASGYMGQANALGGAFNQLGSLGMMYGMGMFKKPSAILGQAPNTMMAQNYTGPQYGNLG